MSGCPHLSLFGGFRLAHADGRTIPVNLRKAEALLAFLAVSDRQTVSREVLAFLLWGEYEQHRARQSLRQVLLALTKSLGACERPILHIDSQQVALRPGALSVDVVQFEALVSEGSLESLGPAVMLYRGDFLAGLRLDAPDYEDWISATRGRLQDLAVKGLVGLLDYQEQAEDTAPAIATANQALRIDPFREDLHRRLMSIYLAMGMRSSALAQYRICRDVLVRELGVEPDGETTALYVDILSKAPCAADPEIEAGAGDPLDSTAPGRSEPALVEYRAGLEDAAQALLDTACVAGLRSDCAIVGRAAGLTEDEAAAALEELVAGRAVTVEGEDILFRDAVGRQALYESLVPPRRRRAHGRVAEAIRTLRGSPPEAHFQELAHHFRQAGQPRDALHAAFNAATVETKRGDRAAAARILRDARAAIESLPDGGDSLPIQVDIDLALGRLALAAGDHQEAMRFLKLAEGLAGRLGESGKAGESLILQSRIHHRAGKEQAAYAVVRRGLALAERGGCGSPWLPVESLLARLHLVGGDCHGASYRLGRRIQRAAVLGLEVDRAEASALLAVVTAIRGNFDEAFRDARAAVAMVAAAGCGSARMACREAEGLVLLWHGDHDAARDCFDAALRGAEALGDLPRIYVLSGLRALCLIAGGRGPEGIEALGDAIAMAERINTGFLLPLFKARLAEAVAGTASDGAALGVALDAHGQAVAANDPWAVSVALRAVALASMAGEVPDLGRAERAIGAAIATQDSLGLSFELAASLVVQAEVLRLKGARELSGQARQRAGTLFREMGMPQMAERTDALCEARGASL